MHPERRRSVKLRNYPLQLCPHAPSALLSVAEQWLPIATDIVVVVVVVFFTLTNRASTIPSNIRGCQSGTWPQRGTKVNGSHHGDNPLLGPTGIQIATKSYANLQAMAPANNKTVHQTSFTPYREQPRPTTAFSFDVKYDTVFVNG